MKSDAYDMYVLQLVKGKRYVGKTQDFIIRMQ